MTNINPYKNQQDYSPLNVSSFMEPQKIGQTPNMDINLAPTPSLSFYRKNTPISSTPQNSNNSLYQSNSFLQNSMLANSPYVPIQTPAMPGMIQSPINVKTPMINLGAAKSPQTKLYLYNPLIFFG